MFNKEFTGDALGCSRFPVLRFPRLEGKQLILRQAGFLGFGSDRGASWCRVQGTFEFCLLLRRVGPVHYSGGCS